MESKNQRVTFQTSANVVVPFFKNDRIIDVSSSSNSSSVPQKDLASNSSTLAQADYCFNHGRLDNFRKPQEYFNCKYCGEKVKIGFNHKPVCKRLLDAGGDRKDGCVNASWLPK